MSAAFARPYAEAFLDSLPEGANRAAIVEGLAAVASALAANRDLRLALSNPAVTLPAKEAIVTSVARAAGLAESGARLLTVVLRHRRLLQLAEILDAIRQAADAREGVVPVDVAAASEVGAGERRMLEAALARRLGKKIRATFRVEAKLVAGFVVRVGSEVLDASVAGALDRFKEEANGN